MNAEEGQQHPDFNPSPDYRSVNYKGKLYSFTGRAAEVIQILHQQYLLGSPELGKDYILEKIGCTSKNMRDVFQRCPGWKKIIIRGETRGTYLLNLPLRQAAQAVTKT